MNTSVVESAIPSPTENPTDGSLLRRFQRGNEEAATQLYLRYARRLYRLAESQCPQDLSRRFDADDIVQSVFSSFLPAGDRQGYYAVPDGEELWKLLLVIALNKIRSKGSYHRAACRDIRVTCPDDMLEDASDEKHDETALSFLRLVVTELLEQQPEVYRRIVEMRIEGYELAEIADRVQRSRRTVERALQEFREQLQKSLGA